MIKDHEGLRLKAYLDPVGIWTIGWGHTGRVHSGETITRERAEELLMLDIEKAEACIERSVSVSLTQGMFDSLVSFIFNLGCGAFRQSTLLRHLNNGDYEKAAHQFPRWVHAKGRRLPGLVRRREDERQLFLQEVV